MSLPVLIKLPDSLIEESQYFTTVTQNPNRSTTGVASYTNPRTLATYSVASGGQEALALYMYETNPALKNYIFSDTVYAEIKSNIETAQTDITNLETDVDIINTAVSDTGLVNAMVVDTVGTFDMAKNGSVTPFIIPLFTNTGTATLSIDGGTVTEIRKADDSGTLVILEEGDYKKNVPVQFVLDTVSGFFIYAPKGGKSIKVVYSGVATIGAGVSQLDVAISPLKSSNSFIHVRQIKPTGTFGNSFDKLCVDAYFLNDTTIRFSRVSTTDSVLIYWEAEEYLNVKSSQSGQKIISTTTDSVTVSTTDINKSIVQCNFKSSYSSNIDANIFLGYRLTTSTLLNFYQFASIDKQIRWKIIELS